VCSTTKNLVPLAHLEHGGAFEDTITVFGADVGAVEVPLDELERYASQPFGVAIAPTSRGLRDKRGSEIVTVVDVHTDALHPYASCTFCAGSFGQRQLLVTRIPVGTIRGG